MKYKYQIRKNKIQINFKIKFLRVKSFEIFLDKIYSTINKLIPLLRAMESVQDHLGLTITCSG